MLEPFPTGVLNVAAEICTPKASEPVVFEPMSAAPASKLVVAVVGAVVLSKDQLASTVEVGGTTIVAPCETLFAAVSAAQANTIRFI